MHTNDSKRCGEQVEISFKLSAISGWADPKTDQGLTNANNLNLLVDFTVSKSSIES